VVKIRGEAYMRSQATWLQGEERKRGSSRKLEKGKEKKRKKRKERKNNNINIRLLGGYV